MSIEVQAGDDEVDEGVYEVRRAEFTEYSAVLMDQDVRGCNILAGLGGQC